MKMVKFLFKKEKNKDAELTFCDSKLTTKLEQLIQDGTFIRVLEYVSTEYKREVKNKP